MYPVPDPLSTPAKERVTELITQQTTSPRLRGEVVSHAQRGFRVRGKLAPRYVVCCAFTNRPLTPTLSRKRGEGLP
jgi:hypothetical protein